ATLRKHDVVVELLRQRFPQLQRVVVERGALREEIIGADDGRVTTGVPAADPAFFQHRDVTESVLLREVVRSAESVTASAHDDRVIRRLGLRSAPLWLPASLAGQATTQERQAGERLHLR